MKYFAICGKNPILSELELSFIATKIHKEWNIFFFDTENFQKCKYLAGFTKVGELISLNEFIAMPKKLVWTNIYLKPSDKQKYNIKRYKKIQLIKTDLEVKNKWIESIFFRSIQNKVWIVKFYQNIQLYEAIDFDKPVRSMWIGMMPWKLTHLLINLATWLNYNKTIYDPFVGLWTTMMIGNWLWNHIIWSDLNPSPVKQNRKWFQQTKFYNPNFKYSIFKQDITQPFKNKIVHFTTNVVSEWYLWPKIGKFLNEREAINNEKTFQQIYINWITNLFSLPNLENIVITFPIYKLRNWTFYYFLDTYEKIKKQNPNIKINVINENYYRNEQKVGRQVVVIDRRFGDYWRLREK